MSLQDFPNYIRVTHFLKLIAKLPNVYSRVWKICIISTMRSLNRKISQEYLTRHILTQLVTYTK